MTHTPRKLPSFTPVLGLLLAMLLLALACEKRESSTASRGTSRSSGSTDIGPEEPLVELVFPYGSEKKAWIQEVTETFNASRARIRSGKIIQVKALPLGSGESKDDILEGRLQAHLWSPASGAFVTLGNAQSATKGSPLVGQTEELVLSPVVIAMWRPMAEALGWPDKPIGWGDILQLAKNPSGWAGLGHSEFGSFKFGHTHPEYSNSGLISILAEVYAATGKARGLSREDVQKASTAQYLKDIEAAVVHYGRSTGFFGQTLYDTGPQYLSAAVLYENMVIESYGKGAGTPLVAIYPKEGTFWSNHPVGILQRPWVSDEHKEAARIYIDYLLAPTQQGRALAHGFRPARGNVGSPIDMDHGADPTQPKTILEVPSAQVIQDVIDLWHKNKKASTVVLVFDKSGSMGEQNKMVHAKAGAKALVDLLGDEDSLSLVPFSSDVAVIAGGPLQSHREVLLSRINALVPEGNTRLYRATEQAYQHLVHQPRKGRICAVVVLTDGEDNDKQYSLDQLLAAVQGDIEKDSVRIFTIAYGKGPKVDVLRRISRETKAQCYEGKPENIREVFKDIATFF